MTTLIQKNSNILLLHFTVLIWGFTGVLGDLISVSALPLVWYRVGIASVALLLFFLLTKKNIFIDKKSIVKFVGVGGIVAVHWILFFYAIKISTVSVALVTLSSVTLFTAILEPIIYKRKIPLLDILVGIVIIIGIYTIFKFEQQYVAGILAALLCAFCASLFSILNGKLVKNNSATLITFYEMLGAFFWVSIFMLFSGDFGSGLILSNKDLMLLLLLGVVCTAFAYVLGVYVMKELSAFTVALTTNLEPVYGILIAMFLLGHKEKMSIGFYIGAVIVLGAVFTYPYIRTTLEKRKKFIIQKLR